MSYLNWPRLHFSGRFKTTPPTVNNKKRHFALATFDSKFQTMAGGGGVVPFGDGRWTLLDGCTVESAVHADGRAVAVGGMRIVDGGGARIVDLHPDQTLVSEIWGLELTVIADDGTRWLRGLCAPTACADLRECCPGATGDEACGATFQSVLTALEWAPGPLPTILEDLRDRSKDRLSLKFNVDGFNWIRLAGRIAGTIGPATESEPSRMVIGRQLREPDRRYGCVAAVDGPAGAVHVDVGNALKFRTPRGDPVDVGPLQLRCGSAVIGEVDYRTSGFYGSTAGVASVPVAPAALEALTTTPLRVTCDEVEFAEHDVHVQADRFVYRLDPGDTARVPVHASAFGQPAAGVELVARPRGDALGLELAAPVRTGSTGMAEVAITARDPGLQEFDIDGVVYAVDIGASCVQVRVFDAFQCPSPTWLEHIQPIFQQYANLYPVMNAFVRLDRYDSVCAHAEDICTALLRPLTDPRHMPVTRDLSQAKRDAIVRWLRGQPPPL